MKQAIQYEEYNRHLPDLPEGRHTSADCPLTGQRDVLYQNATHFLAASVRPARHNRVTLFGCERQIGVDCIESELVFVEF